ncbi:nucleoside-diphosphate kinase [Paenibacillus montanisoli]|uniref:Nucleoside diphosphate kinase n=1 Tax=Paenibacillus montanisoli TaxID=2081970 RepID=A0A328U2N3_9BACL|nr:nucleoside-diphosphate kinase [Paenibacillus montanisoli]RAP77057.1 nucleoside-diphosphate kinase [Paenibacillus montanisoli]
MQVEQTFVMVKPDGVRRGLIGPIISRFEQKGFELAAISLRTIDRQLAEQHYGELREKPFFGELVDYLTSGPVCAMIWRGRHAVENARAIIGRTNPVEAGPGTIRGDYGMDISGNIVHGSDSDASAAREIALFFNREAASPPVHLFGGTVVGQDERAVH